MSYSQTVVEFCGVCFVFVRLGVGRLMAILGSHYASGLYLSLFLHSRLCGLCEFHIPSKGLWPFVASGYRGEWF